MRTQIFSCNTSLFTTCRQCSGLLSVLLVLTTPAILWVSFGDWLATYLSLSSYPRRRSSIIVHNLPPNHAIFKISMYYNVHGVLSSIARYCTSKIHTYEHFTLSWNFLLLFRSKRSKNKKNLKITPKMFIFVVDVFMQTDLFHKTAVTCVCTCSPST